MQGEKLKRTEGQKQEWKQGGGKPRPWERMLRLTRGFGWYRPVNEPVSWRYLSLLFLLLYLSSKYNFKNILEVSEFRISCVPFKVSIHTYRVLIFIIKNWVHLEKVSVGRVWGCAQCWARIHPGILVHLGRKKNIFLGLQLTASVLTSLFLIRGAKIHLALKPSGRRAHLAPVLALFHFLCESLSSPEDTVAFGCAR